MDTFGLWLSLFNIWRLECVHKGSYTLNHPLLREVSTSSKVSFIGGFTVSSYTVSAQYHFTVILFVISPPHAVFPEQWSPVLQVFCWTEKQISNRHTAYPRFGRSLDHSMEILH